MHNKEILLVDDRKENLELLDSFLKKKGYKTRMAMSGEIALASVEAKKPDLILLDIEMPGMSGYEVAARLKQNEKSASIPIIFISAHSDTEAKVEAFRKGGVDFIAKPFANEEVIARVKNHLDLADYQHSLEERVDEAVSQIKHLNSELQTTQEEMVLTLGKIMETRDDDTGRHVLRVATYAKTLAELYGLEEEKVEMIYKAAPFHDAGKVAIPDAILNKPTQLDEEEWKIMQTHAEIGYKIFSKTKQPLLRLCGVIAKEHHEHWDGSGYPCGLKEEEISIEGRIVCIADVLDALTNKRSYKEAWSFDEAVEYIVSQKGTMFDPKLIELFEANLEKFQNIYEELKDD